MTEHNDFNMRAAKRAGLGPDETGHFPSRVPAGPDRGLLLKSPSHPTFFKSVEADQALGFDLFEKGGKLFSFQEPPNVFFNRLPEDEVQGLVQQSRTANETPPLSGIATLLRDVLLGQMQ